MISTKTFDIYLCRNLSLLSYNWKQAYFLCHCAVVFTADNDYFDKDDDTFRQGYKRTKFGIITLCKKVSCVRMRTIILENQIIIVRNPSLCLFLLYFLDLPFLV